MHVRKATDELLKLAAAPATLGTFTTAYVLLAGLDTDNEDVNDEERRNGTVHEKLHSARNWFEILCGIGEEGNWPEERLRHFIRQDLFAVKEQIDVKGSSSSHFKRWPAGQPASAR
jgi:hypothetical protein